MIRRLSLLAAATLMATASPAFAQSSAKTIADLKARIAATKLQIERARSYDQIENIENAYGYYVDKNLWDNVADLFAKDGSTMELAQRGYYVGQDRIRAFLHDFGGKEGPSANRLGVHAQFQPVIHVAPDNKTAKVRIRLMQIMGQAGGRGSLGGGIYENELVNEGGVWKFKTVHVYNTFTASWDEGPLKSRGGLPGPSKRLPPDGPPTLVFQAFPKVENLPIHYKNPVTGK